MRIIMETVTFKLQKEIIERVDSLLKPLNFSNRTEFIRESIREKLNSIENDLVLMEVIKFKGSSRKNLSDERLHMIRDKVAKRYAKKFNVDLD
jgi:Arc/MetJ-type ribon-helix-helix transcriptional regulator